MRNSRLRGRYLTYWRLTAVTSGQFVARGMKPAFDCPRTDAPTALNEINERDVTQSRRGPLIRNCSRSFRVKERYINFLIYT